MIDTMILAGILYAHYVADAFHHADGPAVAGVVRADRAHIIVRNHHALAAVSDIISKTVYGLCEMMHIFLRLLKKMQGQAQGTPTAYTRKSAYCIYCFFKQF
jgi:hypothetical protein